jgi:hypothetical protein
MRKFLVVLLILLAACAPAVTPQASSSKADPTSSPPPPTSRPTVTPPPTRTISTQPPIGETVTTQTPSGSTASGLWLRILSPEDGDTVSTPTIKIKGQAPAETVVTVNDQVFVVSTDQLFEAEVKLDVGPNLIEIVASDLTENEIYIPLTIDYEP